MRKLFVIGVGAGNPDYITVQAINALKQVQVVFAIDKGEDKADLLQMRRTLCERGRVNDKQQRKDKSRPRCRWLVSHHFGSSF